MMHLCPGRQSLRRIVHYFHGFDPATTARYRRIFAAASERFGVSIEDPDGDWDGWIVDRDDVRTEVRYHRYEDLVRAQQAGGIAMRLGRGIRTMIGYLAVGALGRLPLRTLVLMLSPYLIAFAPVLLFAVLSDDNITFALAAGGAATVMAYLLLYRYRVILVSDLFAYMRSLARGTDAAAGAHLERVRALTDAVSSDGEQDVLIVGHSLGGLAAIGAVATLLDRLPAGQKLGLLTLGSVQGIVLAQRGLGRDRLAKDIARVCADPRVFWVDVTSPRDAFCVPLTDPLLLIGDEAREHMVSPKIISAQLKRAPAIPGDRRTVFAAMRRHMGYLLKPVDGAGFDYADTISGKLSLSARFGNRNSSPRARLWRG